MNEIGDLELNVLSCLLIKPDLMNEIKLEDKHFIKHKRTWQFMKSFYKKFGNFDIQLMYAVCKNKYHLIEYMIQIVNIEPTYSNFDKYQDLLIKQYEETKKDKYIKERIYELANDLYVGNINVNDFQDKVQEIYDVANEIYNKM